MHKYHHLSLKCLELIYNSDNCSLFFNSKQVGSTNLHFLHIKLALESFANEFYKGDELCLSNNIQVKRIIESCNYRIDDKVIYTNKIVNVNFSIVQKKENKSLLIKFEEVIIRLTKRELKFLIKWLALFFKDNNLQYSTIARVTGVDISDMNRHMEEKLQIREYKKNLQYV